MIRNPELALDKIEQILKKFETMEEQEIYGAYATAKTLIKDLKEYAKEEEMSDAGTRLGTLEWHTGAMFGFDENNGHSPSQHCSWARQEIYCLRSLTSLIEPLTKAA